MGRDTLHPTPYTLHPTPFTQHPTPNTIQICALVMTVRVVPRSTIHHSSLRSGLKTRSLTQVFPVFVLA